jgi:hypothetical protein
MGAARNTGSWPEDGSFELLVAAHWRQLFRFAYRASPSTELAMRATETTFELAGLYGEWSCQSDPAVTYGLLRLAYNVVEQLLDEDDEPEELPRLGIAAISSGGGGVRLERGVVPRGLFPMDVSGAPPSRGCGCHGEARSLGAAVDGGFADGQLLPGLEVSGRGWREAAVAAALERLPYPDRAAFILAFWMELPLEEAAWIAGVRPRAFSIRLTRAVRRVERHFQASAPADSAPVARAIDALGGAARPSAGSRPPERPAVVRSPGRSPVSAPLHEAIALL